MWEMAFQSVLGGFFQISIEIKSLQNQIQTLSLHAVEELSTMASRTLWMCKDEN